jgi:hypothetical protein
VIITPAAVARNRMCRCGCAWKGDPTCWACGADAEPVPVPPHLVDGTGPREESVGTVLTL